MDYLFILGRILLGGFFIESGVGHLRNLEMLAGYAKSKGVPMPKLAVAGTGIMLILGGAGIVAGVYITLSVILLAIFLIVTTFTMHAYWKDTDQMQKMNNRINFGKNIALLGSVLMLLYIPLPWVMSLVF